VFVTLPREGSGSVWRQGEVPAFPRNLPRPTPRAAANTYNRSLQKKVTRFSLAHHS